MPNPPGNVAPSESERSDVFTILSARYELSDPMYGRSFGETRQRWQLVLEMEPLTYRVTGGPFGDNREVERYNVTDFMDDPNSAAEFATKLQTDRSFYGQLIKAFSKLGVVIKTPDDAQQLVGQKVRMARLIRNIQGRDIYTRKPIALEPHFVQPDNIPTFHRRTAGAAAPTAAASPTSNGTEALLRAIDGKAADGKVLANALFDDPTLASLAPKALSGQLLTELQAEGKVTVQDGVVRVA